MTNSQQVVPDLIVNLNMLCGSLFILATIGIVMVRQVRACLRFFVAQSAFLAASAFLLGVYPFSAHLLLVAGINLLVKVFLLPWLLLRLMSTAVYTRREITQVLSIPTSLFLSLILTLAAYFFTLPWLQATSADAVIRVNLPLGLAALLLGAYTISVRREAVPQLLGLLAMENGAFFAGIAIAPDLPLIAELALAFDLLVLTLVVGVLTRTMHIRLGTTAVGDFTNLREDSRS